MATLLHWWAWPSWRSAFAYADTECGCAFDTTARGARAGHPQASGRSNAKRNVQRAAGFDRAGRQRNDCNSGNTLCRRQRTRGECSALRRRLLEEGYVKSRQKFAFCRQSSFGRLLSVGVDVNGSVCFLICPGAVIFLSNHNVASQKINKSG